VQDVTSEEKPGPTDLPGFIEIAGLSKRYPVRGGAPVTALSDINLKIAEGEFVCIVGPSGCGKSTLLKILAGIVPSFDGSVAVDGRRISGPSRDVGVVFQQPHLLPWRTVIENVMLPVELQRRSGPAYRERAERLIGLVGLSDFCSRYPAELSGGMQQRVSICRALVHDPKVLLMDEPFGALDAMTREFMNVELLRIWSSNRKTALFITHSIVEAVFLADRVAVMSPRPGRVQEIVNVELPRPRTPAMMTSAAFGEYAGHIRSYFELKAGVDL
jgi:NitT/TauT family transport system ATP-binding protein